jgi:imidazolonepropionase-like amidohydrolase
MRPVIVFSLLALGASTAEAQRLLAIRDVTVIDGTGAPPHAHRTVLVKDDRIWRVDSANASLPRGARVIDGRGMFVLPGLIDMHAHYSVGPVTFDTTKRPPAIYMTHDHAASVEQLQTLLAFGITTIRNPGGATRQSVAVRDSVRLGMLRGPRIFTAGEVIDATEAPGLVETVHNEKEVRDAVDRQVALGVDYVKLYASLGPDLIRAGVDQAHRRGVRAIAHLFATTWTDAANAGIDGIVHITPGAPRLLPLERRPEFLKRFRGTQFMLEWFSFVDIGSPEIKEMTEALIRHDVFIDPTLVTFEAMAWGDSARIRESSDLTLAPPSLLAGWRKFDLTFYWKPGDFEEARKAWPNVLGYTKYLFDAGVQLTAGTDMANPWTVPGASLHRELELLAASGIPTLQVLRIATRNGARSLGIESEVGTIAPGKIADLVVLSADPIADIRNTRRIAWVVQSGQPSRPAELLPPRLRAGRGVPESSKSMSHTVPSSSARVRAP